MTEFTGERVIPGEVNDDLWAEHIARYAFASRFAEGKRTLDIGCGTGYGVGEFARCSSASFGIDVSADAVSYARAHSPGAFLQGSATALPFADGSFDLVTAFEVIEHLSDWNGLLAEARRVVREDGVFLLSTPNKVYYAESRAEEGANPFHVHEFEFEEFRRALLRHFPAVTILLQNRLDAIAVLGVGRGDSGVSGGGEGISNRSMTVAARLEGSSVENAGEVDSRIDGKGEWSGRRDRSEHVGSGQRVDGRVDGASGGAEEAHFFLAVCSGAGGVEAGGYLYVSRASNLLRERERHIKLLQDELALSKQWLDDVIAERQKLMDVHAAQTEHLEEHNRWALRLESEWRAALERISQVQIEMQREQNAAMEVAGAYENKVRELELENRRRAEWALDIERRLSESLAARSAELTEAVRLLDLAEGTVIDRTVWAQQLQLRVSELEAQLRMIRESRWIRVGRVVGLGPRLDSKVKG